MEWLLALVGVGLLAAIWGIGIERHLYTVRQTEIAGVLPAGSKPIRVLHVSDFHLAPWQKLEDRNLPPQHGFRERKLQKSK